MKYIDKHRNKRTFNAISCTYLKESYQEGIFYPHLHSTETYNNFSHKKYKHGDPGSTPNRGWLSILKEDQDSLCCYCMRRINDEKDVSVEHLIPERMTDMNADEEFKFYFLHSPYLAENVMSTEEYEKRIENEEIRIESCSRFPHLVAHGNLFWACNCDEYGCSCNNKRGNKRILPMMLMENVEDFTEYGDDGKFKISHEDVEASKASLENLNLNTSTLKTIRKTWYLLSRKKFNLDPSQDYSFEEKDRIIRAILNKDETDIIDQEMTVFLTLDTPDGEQKDYYWNLLLQYNWFYGYYLRKFPPD